MRYDAVVIGAGISGLVDAILLAESGRRVAVFEQHSVPGGYLQQFRRKQTVFDVGFHYMGSTSPGRPMRQLLEHLRIWERLEFVPFPDDGAIEVRRGERRFAYPSRFDRFLELAEAEWPGEREALRAFARDVEETCSRFKWFHLRRGREYRNPLELDLPRGSFADYLDRRFLDPWLKRTLSFQSFNLGLHAHEIPYLKHALAFRSNFDVTSRIAGGGGALVDALVERGRELGVEYRFRESVCGFDCTGRRVRAVRTDGGERVEADVFVAACHPKPILRCIGDDAIGPVFKNRILAMKESRGALQIFLRLKGPLSSVGATCVMLDDPEEAAGDPPLSTLLVTCPSAIEQAGRGGPRLEAMTYLPMEPFARWRELPVMRRGADYERLKEALARRVIGMIARVAPELPELIEDVYAATPLTDEWYTRNEEGGVFGVSHDVSQQGVDRPQTRIRLRNLYFTGHSVMMPGICGVFINAFDTCDQIRGDGVLFGSCAS